jgi:hypothetical protein
VTFSFVRRMLWQQQEKVEAYERAGAEAEAKAEAKAEVEAAPGIRDRPADRAEGRDNNGLPDRLVRTGCRSSSTYCGNNAMRASQY